MKTKVKHNKLNIFFLEIELVHFFFCAYVHLLAYFRMLLPISKILVCWNLDLATVLNMPFCGFNFLLVEKKWWGG